VVWDRIVESKEEAKLNLQGEFLDYPLRDPAMELRWVGCEICAVDGRAVCCNDHGLCLHALHDVFGVGGATMVGSPVGQLCEGTLHGTIRVVHMLPGSTYPYTEPRRCLISPDHDSLHTLQGEDGPVEAHVGPHAAHGHALHALELREHYHPGTTVLPVGSLWLGMLVFRLAGDRLIVPSALHCVYRR
jgi:hypothetical protein